MGEGKWKQVQLALGSWNWSDLDKVVNSNRGRRIIVMPFLRADRQKDDAEFTPYTANMSGR